MTPERAIKNLSKQVCCIKKQLNDLDEVIYFSYLGTNDLLPLAVPGILGKLYIDIDTGEQWMANPTGGSPYYLRIEDKTGDITLDFTSGILTYSFYAPYAMKITSITDVLNAPTTTITNNASPYTLGASIALGNTIVVTVNSSSVVRLNYTKL